MPVTVILRLGAVLAVVALLCALSVVRLVGERTVALQLERIGLVATQLRDRIQPSLELGLPLHGLTFVQDLLVTERRRTSSILSIDVYDRAGRLLFSTDRGGIGDAIPEEWERARSAADALWSTARQDISVMGMPLRNGFEVPVGDVVLRYDRQAAVATTGGFDRLFAPALLAAAMAATFLAVAAWLLVRPRHAGLQAVARTLVERRPVGQDRWARAGGGLAALLPDFLAKADQAECAFAEARQELKAIDEQA